MHLVSKAITLVGIAALSTVALAQEEEEAQAIFTYATYFYCDVNGQDKVDEIVKTTNQPVYDQMVKEGLLKRWGWLAHHTGGKWRRVQYYQAGSVEALLDAQEEMNKRFDAMEDDGNTTFGSVCNAHDDYIWEVESGSGGEGRSDAGFSVYYKCDETKEERADEIWEKDFAIFFESILWSFLFRKKIRTRKLIPEASEFARASPECLSGPGGRGTSMPNASTFSQIP